VVKGQEMENIRFVMLSHPVANNTLQELLEKAETAVDDIVERLTSPLTEEEMTPAKVIPPAERVVFKGTFEQVNDFFYRSLWSDGLPVVLPTQNAVENMLTGTDLHPEDIVALVPPASQKATVEKIAVNAVMAGARPEYMPVIIAAVRAITDPRFWLAGIQQTTNPVTPLLIVNGPIRKDLDINSGSGCFGPGWRANATIGRAIRLIMINIGGAFPKVNDLATQGQPGKYTMCIAENEEALPPTWEPLHVELGFNKDISTVTAFPAQDMRKTGYGLAAMAEGMMTATQYPTCANLGQVLTVFSPEDIKLVLNGIYAPPTIVEGCLTKEAAKRYLYENSAVPWERHIRGGYTTIWRLSGHYKPSGAYACVQAYENGRVPIVQAPEKIVIVVAGGAGLHSVAISSAGISEMVTREIQLPTNWDELLASAKPHGRSPL
jgi:hypothetical protein